MDLKALFRVPPSSMGGIQGRTVTLRYGVSHSITARRHGQEKLEEGGRCHAKFILIAPNLMKSEMKR